MSVAQHINPTVTKSLFGGMVTLYGYGRHYDEENKPCVNWSLKGIERFSEHTDSHHHIIKALGSIPKAQKILAPSPDTFNAAIIDGKKGMLQAGCIVNAIKETNIRALYRGPKADGIVLREPTETFAMSSADCALIVIKAGNSVVAAHAGRDSVLDRIFIDSDGEKKGRDYFSVVDAAMASIPSSFPKKDIEAYIGFSISKGQHFAHPFDHPVYGASNQKMIHHLERYFPSSEDDYFDEGFWYRGEISLSWLIGEQLKKHGVSQIETDPMCTFLDKDASDRPLWFSQRRKEDNGWRNLVAVVRNK